MNRRLAKVTVIASGKVLIKVEKALNFWVEDVNRKKVPVDGKVLRQKALSLYEDFQKKDGAEEKTKPFRASRGCLNRFRNMFNPKNIKIIDEAASADEKASATFPAVLKKLSRRENTILGKCSTVTEQACFGRKRPTGPIFTKAQNRPQDLKHGRIDTLVLCSNAAGHTIKHGVVYPTKNPRALKKKKLPVFWQPNLKALVTAVLFTEWFHQCFIPEVKEYLEKEGLPLKFY